MSNPGTIVTIFGGTGDLTYRKLLPAFYNLVHGDQFSKESQIVIIGRRDMTTESYRAQLLPWLQKNSRFSVNDTKLDDFLSRIYYFEMKFTDFEGYPRLGEFYKSLDPKHSLRHLFYFAVSPSFFVDIAKNLHTANLTSDAQLIIEKPFGNDLQSSIEINEALTHYFSSDNIFRIDHYLAKEMVQNILTLRFENALFESVWNRDMIDNIQLSVGETVGVENRGNFYDTVGALKDMVQSHLLQVLSIALMEKPEHDGATCLHEKQEDVLDKLYIKDPKKDIIYAQYTSNGKYKGYHEELNVNPESKTETFVAFKAFVDNPRWEGVPIFVRTGKRMRRRSSEIVFQLKSKDNSPANMIVIKIQPDEGVYIRFNVNKPGSENEMQTVYLDFCKSCNYEFRKNTPEAYERLLKAAINSDHTLFASFKQVTQCWSLIEDWISASKHNLTYEYEAFSNGPEEANALLESQNTSWFEEEVLGDIFEKENAQ